MYSSPPALTGGRIDLPSLPPAIALPLAPRWLLTRRGSLQVAGWRAQAESLRATGAPAAQA
eukprot:5855009-Prymnesium_polylepis.1